jgi:hypothetical protein
VKRVAGGLQIRHSCFDQILPSILLELIFLVYSQEHAMILKMCKF